MRVCLRGEGPSAKAEESMFEKLAGAGECDALAAEESMFGKWSGVSELGIRAAGVNPKFCVNSK